MIEEGKNHNASSGFNGFNGLVSGSDVACLSQKSEAPRPQLLPLAMSLVPQIVPLRNNIAVVFFAISAPDHDACVACDSDADKVISLFSSL